MIHEYINSDSIFIKHSTGINSWPIPNDAESLNIRAHLMLEKNETFIAKKKVLIIGCHNGIFPYFCLKLGANFVKGLFLNNGYVETAKNNFQSLNLNPNKYAFEETSPQNYLKLIKDNEYDTIICLHSAAYYQDHYQFIYELHKKTKEVAIIDSLTANYTLLLGKKSIPTLEKIKKETFSLPITNYIEENNQIVSYSSETLFELAFQSTGFKFDKIDWRKHSDNPITNWQELISLKSKQASHWTDLYSSNIAITYVLRKEKTSNVK